MDEFVGLVSVLCDWTIVHQNRVPPLERFHGMTHRKLRSDANRVNTKARVCSKVCMNPD